MTRALAATIAFLLSLPALAASIEETVARYLALAHEGRFEALPKTGNAEGAGGFENRLRGTLRVRCLRVDGIAVLDVSESSGTADVEIAVSKQDRQSRGAWSGPEVTPLRLRLAREGDRWLVSAVEFPEEEFADRLIAATEAERRTMLAENEHRITGGVAMAIFRRALSLINSPTPEKAPPLGSLAREIAMRAGDRSAEASAIGIAVVYSRIQRAFDAGIAHGREAIAIAEETGDPDALARAWNNISRLIAWRHSALGDFSDEAVAREEEAMRLALLYARQAEDATLLVRTLENHALRAASKLDYYTARAHQEELLPIAREIGDRVGEIGYEIQVANIYSSQGDRELSRFHHQRAMELTKQHDPRRHPYTLIRYAGTLMAEEKRFAEARELLARALPRDEKGAVKLTLNTLTPNMAAHALRTLAAMDAEEGRLEDAACLVAESQSLLPPHDRRNFSYELAPYFEKRGDHRRALEHAMQTVASADMKTHASMQALTYAARAYRALGHPANALSLMREAIDVLEAQDRLLSGGEEQQIRSADLIAGAYELAAELVLERGEVADALALLESGRGRVLAEVIDGGRPDARAAAEQSEERVRLALEQNLATLNVELARAVAAGNRTETVKLEQQLGEERRRHESYVDGLRRRSERRRATRRHFAPSEIRELLGRLPDGMAAVEYFIDSDELHLFVGRNDGAVVHRSVAIGREALRERVNELVKTISTNDLRVRGVSESLYRLLIAPVEKELRAGETLLIVPGDVLWRVSFAALTDSRGNFLIEQWPVVYAPSIAVFNEMAGRRRTRAHEPSMLLAIGNPAIDPAAAAGYEAYYRSALAPLPDAELEVDAVRRLYGSRNCRVLKRHDATESRTKTEMGRAGIVHFATHGLLDDRNPMYSRLALARGSEPSEDGWLETWEIARLEIDADLVVLSACDTARGRIGGGEGVVGMAWAFFVAGARSTLATQWKVESAHTAQMMIRFHEALRGDGDKARALRAAQLASIRHPRHGHPFYWAAFVLFGSDS